MDTKARELRQNAEQEGNLIKELDAVRREISELKENIDNTHFKLNQKLSQIASKQSAFETELRLLNQDNDFII